jgi:hypothetical protein
MLHAVLKLDMYYNVIIENIYYFYCCNRGTCEYGNELSGSVKCGEFLD